MFSTHVLHQSILVYGLKEMISNLKKRNVITVDNYNSLSRQNISDTHKCILLVHYIVDNMAGNNQKLDDFKLFLSSDKRLWHLSMAMHQLSKLSIQLVCIIFLRNIIIRRICYS